MKTYTREQAVAVLELLGIPQDEAWKVKGFTFRPGDHSSTISLKVTKFPGWPTFLETLGIEEARKIREIEWFGPILKYTTEEETEDGEGEYTVLKENFVFLEGKEF